MLGRAMPLSDVATTTKYGNYHRLSFMSQDDEFNESFAEN